MDHPTVGLVWDDLARREARLAWSASVTLCPTQKVICRTYGAGCSLFF